MQNQAVPLPSSWASFLLSSVPPPRHLYQGLLACLATRWLPHFYMWPWEYVTPSSPPRPGPQRRASVFPLGTARASLSPFSQGSWRTEAITPPPSSRKGLLKPQTRVASEGGTSALPDRLPLTRGVQCGLEGPGLLWGEQALTFSCRGIEGRGSQPGLRARLFPRILRGWDEKFPLIQRF